MDHLGHHDGILCAAVLRLASTLPHPGPEGRDLGRLRSVGCPCDPLHDAPEPVAHQPFSPVLGHLPQPPLRAAGPAGHRAVLPQRQGAPRHRIPLDVAHHRAELRLLYPGGAVGRCDPGHRPADDPQDLRLCVDRPHRLFCHESRIQESGLIRSPLLHAKRACFPAAAAVRKQALLVAVYRRFRLLPPSHQTSAAQIRFPARMPAHHSTVCRGVCSYTSKKG